MPGLYETYRNELSDLEIYEKDDMYKEAKQQEVRCWYDDYFKLLFNTYMKKDIEKIKGFFKDNTIWIKVSDYGDAGDIRLDRAELGKRLINFKDDEGNYIFTQIMRYQIACRCGFEEEMKSLFEKLLLIDKNSIRKEHSSFRYMLSDGPSRENLIERFHLHFKYRDKLVVFWTYWINKDIPEVSDKLKELIGLDKSETLEENRQRFYEYGIINAEGYRYLESLEFFWERLPEKKEELLMSSELNSFSANIHSWCLRSLANKHQRKFSIKSLENGRHFFWQMEKNYFWHDVKTAFSHLKPPDITPEDYKIRFVFISRSVIESPELLKRSGIDLLSYLWDFDGFSEHRQHYLNTINTHSLFLGELLGIGETEVVYRILNMVNEKQFRKFMGHYSMIPIYSDLKSSGKTDYLMMLFDYFKKKDSLAVERFLKKNDPDNLEKIMNYVPDSSNPYSYLAQSSAILEPNYHSNGVDSNVNLVTAQPVIFYKRNFCHYPLL